MRPSAGLRASGMMKRSIEELKRWSNMVVSMEGIKAPTGPYQLLDFTDPDTIPSCKTMSDGDLGGFSTVSLEHVPATTVEPAHARFHGNISLDLPRNRPEVQRTGYAAWRNRDRPASIFGKSLWNMDPYAFLALRFKSDGRKYFVNVQSETLVYTDIHQHRLYTRRPGEWETVLIKWRDFVRTNYGQVVEPQTELPTEKVRTVGIGLTDRVPGPYDLAISKVWATNGLDDSALEHGGIESAPQSKRSMEAKEEDALR